MSSLMRFWQVLMVIASITPFIRWLVKTAAACLAAAALLHSLELWSLFSHVLLAGGLFCLALLTAIWLAVSPYQLLCLVTSKPLGLLPGIRGYSFAALSVVNLGCSIFISQWVGYVIYGSTPVENPLQIFLGVVLYISILMSMTSVLVQKSSSAAGLIGVFIWGSEFFFSWLMRVPGVLLALAIVMVWGFFGYWWFRFRAQEYVQIFFLARLHPTSGQQRTYWWRSKEAIAKDLSSASLFEEMLFGKQINIWVALKRGGWLLLALLLDITIYKAELIAGPPVPFLIFVVMLLMIIELTIVNCIVLGLKKIWLVVSHSRQGIWRLIERRLFQELGIAVVPFLVFVVVSFYFYNPFQLSLNFMLGITACLFAIFIAAAYGALFVYVKKQAYRNWCPVVAVTLAGFMSLLLVFIAETRSGIYLSLFFLANIVLACCLRLWVLRLWPRVNFLQRKT